MVVARLKRDMNLAGITSGNVPDATILNVGDEHAWSVIGAGFQSPLALEEVAFKVTEEQAVTRLAKAIAAIGNVSAGFDEKRLLVVSDSDFGYLVRHATQVSARIALNDKKTTTGGEGNLWYEETLPPETLMYALLLPNVPRNGGAPGIKNAGDVMVEAGKLLNGKYLQIGGNETVGQGWCFASLTGEAK
jgi:CRISPR-associated protein Cmr4